MQEKVYKGLIKDVDELRILTAWDELDQCVIDTAVRQWHTHLRACVKQNMGAGTIFRLGEQKLLKYFLNISKSSLCTMGAGCMVHCNKVCKPVKVKYLLLCMNSIIDNCPPDKCPLGLLPIH